MLPVPTQKFDHFPILPNEETHIQGEDQKNIQKITLINEIADLHFNQITQCANQMRPEKIKQIVQSLKETASLKFCDVTDLRHLESCFENEDFSNFLDSRLKNMQEKIVEATKPTFIHLLNNENQEDLKAIKNVLTNPDFDTLTLWIEKSVQKSLESLQKFQAYLANSLFDLINEKSNEVKSKDDLSQLVVDVFEKNSSNLNTKNTPLNSTSDDGINEELDDRAKQLQIIESTAYSMIREGTSKKLKDILERVLQQFFPEEQEFENARLKDALIKYGESLALTLCQDFRLTKSDIHSLTEESLSKIAAIITSPAYKKYGVLSAEAVSQEISVIISNKINMDTEIINYLIDQKV